MKISTMQFIFALLVSNLFAQSFESDTLTIAELPLDRINFSKWGDFDSDNDFDLLVSWVDTNQTAHINVIRNIGNSQFVLANTQIAPVANSVVEFFDYDNDNDLDVLLAGVDTDGSSSLKLYTNQNGGFQESQTVFPEVAATSIAAFDYNKDGFSDIILTGTFQNQPVTLLLRNDRNGTFSQVTTSLPGLSAAQILTADLNNDAYPDIVLTGLNGSTGQTLIFINNEGANFTQVSSALTGLFNAALSSADFDNDGDFDILISGEKDDSTKTTFIVRNDGNSQFTEVGANLPAKAYTTAKCGDFDNDGEVDILLFKPENRDTTVAKIFINNGDFTFSGFGLFKTDTSLFELTCADINADASLDFLSLEKDTNNILVAKIFKNSSAFNTVPQSPSGLNTSLSATSLTFQWNPAEDAQTPSSGLCYNLRIGTTPGGSEIFSPLARDNGFAKSLSAGKQGKITSFTLPVAQLKSHPQIYWSVQAVDPSFSRSLFAEEQVFVFDFTEIQTVSGVISGVNAGSSDWGDYDNDGDLDLLLTGQDATNGRIAKIYRNDGNNQLTDINAGLTGVASSSAIWFDYNNDNLLDVLISGFSAGNTDFAEIYRNNGDGTFSATNSSLNGAFQSEVDWGDFDNDGDADIIQSGFSLTLNAITKVYRNENGTFTDAGFNLPGISDGATFWCDFDNDGFLDIFISGNSPTLGRITKIYRNTGADFVEQESDFPATSASAAAAADYDNDGDADILITGLTSNQRVSKLFINQGNFLFEESPVAFEGVSNGSVAFGDYNNDGNQDIMLSGFDNNFARISKIYMNNGDATFSEVTSFIQGVIFGTTDWVDFDNDNDLDIFITGSSNTRREARLYQNNAQQPNTNPEKPGVPVATLAQNGLNLNWSAAQDSETPQAALTYNLRIGSTPGGSEIMSALSTAAGIRKIVDTGNIGHKNSFTLLFEDVLEFPSVYWSVQTVDNNFAGSSFSGEGSLNPVITAIADVPNDQGGKVTIQWLASSLDHNVNNLTSYSVWRSLPDEALQTGKNIRTTTINQNTFAWEWLANLPAHRRPTYSYTAETLYDSTSLSNGQHFFIIAAHTENANIFFDSLPVSGFSIDNIAPESPQNLTAALDGTNIILTWHKNSEPDFRNYILYKSKDPGMNIVDLQPFRENLADTVFVSALNEQSVENLFFIVAAQDSSDNISLASNEASLTITDVQYTGDTMPGSFALHQNYPNPFNPDTQIQFDIPEDAQVNIQIFNIKGETIAALVNEKKNAGSHTVRFNAQGLSSGTYFYRIIAGEFTQIRKMTLLR